MKKPRPNRRGLCDLLRLLVLNRTARAKIQFPRRRIFWISARCGSACGNIAGRRADVNESGSADSRPETSACATLPDRFHRRFTMTLRARHSRPLQIVRPPGGRRPRPYGARRASSIRCSGRTAPARPRRLRMVAGLLPPDAGSIHICGIDALRDPVEAKRIVAWVSDEPMIYDKLTPYEYLEFVAGLWSLDADTRRDARARTDGLARPRPARARALRGLLQGHAAEGGARGRAGARAARDHPRRAAHRSRCRLGAAGQARAARARRGRRHRHHDHAHPRSRRAHGRPRRHHRGRAADRRRHARRAARAGGQEASPAWKTPSSRWSPSSRPPHDAAGIASPGSRTTSCASPGATGSR